MSHDALKVLMGGLLSSSRSISCFDSDPANFRAGVFVSLGSDSGLSLLKSAGMRVGVSLGKDLSNTKKTSVVRSGAGVPVLLTLKKARATVTITNYANLVSGTDDAIAVAGVSFVAQEGAATLGQATFQAASSNNSTATSLAAQINARATTSPLVKAYANGAVVTVVALLGGDAGNDIGITYTNNDGNVGATIAVAVDDKLALGSDDYDDIDYVEKGQKVYVDDVTGMATENIGGGVTITDATYVSAVLTGINEDKTESPAAVVDLIGGV